MRYAMTAAWLVAAVACAPPSPAPPHREEADPHLAYCGLPADYVPPWGTEPIPPEQLVDGAIGGGSIPIIGCPPPPPKAGELAIEAIDFRFENTPYKEPNRRMVIAQLAPILSCYAQHERDGAKPEVAVKLQIGLDGLARDPHAAAGTEHGALGGCIERELSTLRLHGEPDGDPGHVSYRYRPYIAR